MIEESNGSEWMYAKPYTNNLSDGSNSDDNKYTSINLNDVSSAPNGISLSVTANCSHSIALDGTNDFNLNRASNRQAYKLFHRLQAKKSEFHTVHRKIVSSNKTATGTLPRRDPSASSHGDGSQSRFLWRSKRLRVATAGRTTGRSSAAPSSSAASM